MKTWTNPSRPTRAPGVMPEMREGDCREVPCVPAGLCPGGAACPKCPRGPRAGCNETLELVRGSWCPEPGWCWGFGLSLAALCGGV